MILERIAAILQGCEGEEANLPPTYLYNENWLLRLVLDWFARWEGPRGDGGPGPLLSPAPGAAWFSEGWLPSAFLPRHKGDRLSESWTRADGVIGHLATGNRGWADLALLPEGTQLVVIEGKLFSRLSSGVRNAPWYDQAARTVACMAEVLRRADRHPGEMDSLAYVLIAPRRRIEEGIFADEMIPGAMLRKVRRRVEDYAGCRDDWFRDWFEPTARATRAELLSWEEILGHIGHHDGEAGHELDAYYGRCLGYQKPNTVAAQWLAPPARVVMGVAERDEKRDEAISRKG
jgi:hypothetical protein